MTPLLTRVPRTCTFAAGELWLKTDLSSEGAAILPLKSGLLTKHKLQLFIETFAP
jgi:hypothetical protein